ncbi:MAG: hypothetical protein IPM76_24160 [Chloroflexi bacterium]|nr:hypothetical protein [Chloroflexota bacterium]
MPTPSSTSANSQPMALLMADTDATQSYVFESNKLPEIRGGSRWLTDLNEDVARMAEKAGGRRVYAGGGGLLAFVPANQAADVVAAVEAYFPRETGAATITAVARPLPPGYTEDQFKLVVDWLSYLLRQRKESKPAPPFWETLPHQVRCESCQKRPVRPAMPPTGAPSVTANAATKKPTPGSTTLAARYPPPPTTVEVISKTPNPPRTSAKSARPASSSPVTSALFTLMATGSAGCCKKTSPPPMITAASAKQCVM